MKKILICFVCVLLLALCIPVQAADSDEITIFYTNDIQSYIDQDLNYAKVAALKASYKTAGKNVLLVDAGDFTQGTVYGATDEGKHCIQLMNLAGYDLATYGNHEFNYTLDRFYAIEDEADFDLVCCNLFYKNEDGTRGEQYAKSYKVYTFGKTKIAFVGIITPTTPNMQICAREMYFAGQYDPQEMYDVVQSAIDAASKEADIVIALGHCGMGEVAYQEWSSEAIIQNTTGLSAFIDAHSHTVCEGQNVKDKAGKDVLLTQTGCYFSAIGQMTIKDGKISTKLLNAVDVTEDATVKAATDEWLAEVEASWGTKIAETETILTINDAEGNRAIRKTSTNLGDLCADAYYWYINEVIGLQCDVAFNNGGSIRVDVEAGDITRTTCKKVIPFSNEISLVAVTGQEILDMLEYSTRKATDAENGGYFQVAGMTYELHTYIPSTVQCDSTGAWCGAPTGEYRVKNIRIYNKAMEIYEPIDLERTYYVGSTNYAMVEGGDGNTVFSLCGYTYISKYIEMDVIALITYIEAFADTDDDGYADIATANSPLADYNGYLLDYDSITGSGRMTEQTTRRAITPVSTRNVLRNSKIWRKSPKKAG